MRECCECLLRHRLRNMRTGALRCLSFDRSVWRSCCETFGLPDPNLPFYCTLKGSRATLNLSSYRLNIVCSSLGIPLNHHEALSDALGCAAIFLELGRRGLDVERMRLNPPARKKCRCS